MEKNVQSLKGLGLTVSQAKVYLAILKLEKATAKTLSNCSKVARAEAYRVLAELEEEGLVEKIIATPTEFKTSPIEDCVRILIERQKTEISKHEKEAAELLQNLKRTATKILLQAENEQFSLVPKKEAITLRTTKALDSAQTSHDSIVSWKKFSNLMLNAQKFGIQDALKRGIKIRFITEKPEDGESLSKNVKTFQKKYFFKVKYLLDAPLAHVGLFDNKEVFINTSTTAGLAQTPLLWSHNPSLIAIVRDYFEITWITSMELIPTENYKARP